MYSLRGRLRNQVASTWFDIWWVIDLPQFEFEFRKFPLFYLCYLSWLENRVFISRGVQVTGVTWRAATRIVARGGDLVQRIRDGQAQVRYSMVERSSGWVTLCAVCTMHKETRSAGFLVWPQNQGRQFVIRLVKKLLGQVFWFRLQNQQVRFGDLAFKSPWRFLGLSLKTKRATVYRLCHKTDGKIKTVRGTHRDLAVCFTWKRVRLEFFSLASRLVEARHGWWTWFHRGGYVELKLKMDGSMRQAASDSSILTLLFSMYWVIVPF
jgi:hypothetical protein